MTSSTRTRTRPLALLVIVGTLGAGTSYAAEDDPRARARQLFRQGETHYDLGEYDQAIGIWRQAYELAPAPLLLFNLGQAYGLKGNCPKALETYRHFLRVCDPSANERASAQASLDSLQEACGGTTPAPTPKPQLGPAPVRDVAYTGRATFAAAGVGVLLGASAGALYAWNQQRYEQWDREDRRLTRAPAGSQNVAAQAVNDDLLGSVKRADKLTVGLGAGAAVCLIGAALLPSLWPQREVTAGAAPGTLAVNWSGTW